MVELFKRCLNAKYIHTTEGGDYAVEQEGDTIYLLFEWSDGEEDWKSNFAFPAKPYKRMNTTWFCHGGFLKVWKSMRDDLETKVAEILANCPEINNIVCVGYSHGAPHSALATENFAFLYGDRLSVSGYGFGAPRVLWGFIPKDVKRRLRNFYTIRNIPDIVTHVPPMLFGFRNAGNLIKIGEKGKYGVFKAHCSDAYIAELQGVNKNNERKE